MRGRTNYTGGAVPVINGAVVQCEVAPGNTIKKGDFVEVAYRGNDGPIDLPILVNWYNMFQRISDNKYLMLTTESSTGYSLVIKIFEELGGAFTEKAKLVIGELHTNLNLRSTKLLDDGNIVFAGKSADDSVNIVVVQVNGDANTLTILQNQDIGQNKNAYGVFKRGSKIIVFYDDADIVEYNYNFGSIDFASAVTMKLTITAAASGASDTVGTYYTSAWSLCKKMEQIDDNTYEYAFYGTAKWGSSSSSSGHAIGNAILKITGSTAKDETIESSKRYSDNSGTRNPATLDGCVNLNNNYFLYIFNYNYIRVRDKNKNLIHDITSRPNDDSYEGSGNTTSNGWGQAVIVKLDEYHYIVTRPYCERSYGTEFFMITFDREYQNMSIGNIINHTFTYQKEGSTATYKGAYKAVGGAWVDDNSFFLILNRSDGSGRYKYFVIEDGVLKEGYEYDVPYVQSYTGNAKLMGFSNKAGNAGDVIEVNVPKALT